MASIRKERATDIAESVYTLYRDKADDWRRDHLGASIIGHRCDRYLWLAFRWAADPKHEGRLLRLFERGQREEDWLIDDLRRAGFTVQSRANALSGTRAGEQDELHGIPQHLFDAVDTVLVVEQVEQVEQVDEQIRIREGHIGGSLDGIISGLPESPEEEHVLEIKTSNVKQWERLRDKGVRSAKPVHYVQMQIYMHKMKLSHALYVSTCKDNDEIYSERVSYSQPTAEKHLERARDAVGSETPPDKLDPSFPPCVLTSRDGTRWPCQFFDVCHGKQMPEQSCRTCIEATPIVDSNGEPVWTCGLDIKDVVPRSPAQQREGCPAQITIPRAVNADISSVDLLSRTVTYQFSDGTKVTE